MQCHDWLPNLRLNSSPTRLNLKIPSSPIKASRGARSSSPLKLQPHTATVLFKPLLTIFLNFFFARPRVLTAISVGALGSKRSSKTQPRPGSLSDAPTYPRHLHGAFTISIGLVSLALSSFVLTSVCCRLERLRSRWHQGNKRKLPGYSCYTLGGDSTASNLGYPYLVGAAEELGLSTAAQSINCGSTTPGNCPPPTPYLPATTLSHFNWTPAVIH